MSTKVLSQQEIEALMSSLTTEEAPEAVQASVDHQPPIGVKVYDFRRPDRFSKEQLRALRIMHEAFARRLGSAFGSYLRTGTQIHLASVEQITYDEYIRSLPSPTVVYVITPAPLPGQILAEMRLDVTRSIIDRLLGGPGILEAHPREITEIEQSLLHVIGNLMMSCFRESWADLIPLTPRIQEPSLTPEVLQVTFDGETTVVLTFEIMINHVSGTASICIPHPVLQPVMEKLTARIWSATSTERVDEKPSKNLFSQLRQAKVPVVVDLGQAELTVRDILSLTPGRVVKLDTAVDSGLPVRVGGHVKFEGRVGLSGKNLAIQITRITD